MPRREIDEKTKQEIKDLRREGLPFSKIAENLGISKSSAYKHGKDVEVPPSVKRKQQTGSFGRLTTPDGEIVIRDKETLSMARRLFKLLESRIEGKKEES